MTSDHIAFLAGINESPDDYVRRLVFADWLDDTGGPDDASFARFIGGPSARLPLAGKVVCHHLSSSTEKI